MNNAKYYNNQYRVMNVSGLEAINHQAVLFGNMVATITKNENGYNVFITINGDFAVSTQEKNLKGVKATITEYKQYA